MSYFTYIFCESDRPIALSDISEFISDGVFFDDPPTYTPQPFGQLGQLSIRYDNNHQPLIIERVPTNDKGDPRGEAIDATYRTRISGREQAELRKRIEFAQQIISFQFDRSDLTKNAWAMLDCLENDLIKNRSGILYAYDDGFYGEGPKLLASLRK